MRYSTKPVRRCHPCLLNLGDQCWIFAFPRGQWRGERRCPAFENPDVYDEFRKWQKRPVIRSRKELRREFLRARKRKIVRRLLRH
jgi:hypothetical protein